MMGKAAVLAVALMTLTVGLNCGGPAPTSSSNPVVKDNPSFSADIQPMFNASGCTSSGCHDAVARQAGLTLVAGSSYSNLVNVFSTEVPTQKRVAPGDAAGSYLVNKLEGTASVGERMPRGGQALSANEVQLIKNWITHGAKNN